MYLHSLYPVRLDTDHINQKEVEDLSTRQSSSSVHSSQFFLFLFLFDDKKLLSVEQCFQNLAKSIHFLQSLFQFILFADA